MKVDTYNTAAKKVGTLELSDEVFGADYNEALIHQVVVAQLANKRQGTKSTLTRTEVRGGGKKPWRQKGTGRARQGSIRSPQWTGGGVVFAPKPRDYSFKMNRKEKRAALKSALTSRVDDSKLIVVDELKMDTIKTKRFAEVLKNLNVKKALVIINENDKNIVLSARNIPGVKVALCCTAKNEETDKIEVNSTMNVYDILKYDTVVVTKSAVATIEEVYA